MIARSAMSFVIALLGSVVLDSVAVASEIKSPPTIREVHIDKPFQYVYVGNEVTVTMLASAPDGISELNVSVMSDAGRYSELMVPNLRLTATGRPEQLRGSFVVPATLNGSDKPLPKGLSVHPYRLLEQ